MNIIYNLTFEIPFSTLDPFLRYWACRYRDPQRDTTHYDPHIRANLQADWNALKALFEWKNGGTIAEKKLKSVCTNYFKGWTPDDRLECRYLDPDNMNGGPIWNIFYLHCRNPDKYPIFDQHTYRAMRFMETGSLEELTSKSSKAGRTEVFNSYRHYISFVEKFDADKRQVDRALFTFGQFLKLAKSFATRSKATN